MLLLAILNLLKRIELPAELFLGYSGASFFFAIADWAGKTNKDKDKIGRFNENLAILIGVFCMLVIPFLKIDIAVITENTNFFTLVAFAIFFISFGTDELLNSIKSTKKRKLTKERPYSNTK